MEHGAASRESAARCAIAAWWYRALELRHEVSLSTVAQQTSVIRGRRADGRRRFPLC